MLKILNNKNPFNDFDKKCFILRYKIKSNNFIINILKYFINNI